MSKSFGYAAFVGLLAAACSGGDPGALKFTVPWEAGPTGISASPVKEAGGPVVPVPDSGAVAVVDAGKVPAPSPFEDSYKSVEIGGDNTAVKIHQLKGKPDLTGNSKTTQCMGCHASGEGITDAAMKNFLFAGYASSDVDGASPLVNAEVWLVDAAGKRLKTNTDTNGHFWFLKGTQTIVPPFYTGIRSASTQTIMKSSFGGTPYNPKDGSCNQCHDKKQAIGGFITLTGT